MSGRLGSSEIYVAADEEILSPRTVMVSRRCDKEPQHTLPRHGMYHIGLPLREASKKQH